MACNLRHPMGLRHPAASPSLQSIWYRADFWEIHQPNKPHRKGGEIPEQWPAVVSRCNSQKSSVSSANEPSKFRKRVRYFLQNSPIYPAKEPCISCKRALCIPPKSPEFCGMRDSAPSSPGAKPWTALERLMGRAASRPSTGCCSVMQCDVECCSVLQCVAVCCSVLQLL